MGSKYCATLTITKCRYEFAFQNPPNAGTVQKWAEMLWNNFQEDQR